MASLHPPTTHTTASSQQPFTSSVCNVRELLVLHPRNVYHFRIVIQTVLGTVRGRIWRWGEGVVRLTSAANAGQWGPRALNVGLQQVFGSLFGGFGTKETQLQILYLQIRGIKSTRALNHSASRHAVKSWHDILADRARLATVTVAYVGGVL